MGKNSFGFYDVRLPLPVPSNSKSTMTVSENKLILNFEELDSKIHQYFPDNEGIENYFIGGESEALSRLSSKVIGKQTLLMVFKNLRHAPLIRKNEPREPSTTGLSIH